MSVSSEPVQQEYNTPQDVINRFNHALELNAQGNYEAAKNIFEELSSCGIAPAQMELAFFYIYGQCCEKNAVKGFQLMKAAADANYEPACLAVFQLYKNGIGVSPSIEEGYSYLAQPLLEENAEAFYELGNLYYEGNYYERSYRDALSWYEKAAEQGYGPAISTMAYMYLNGEGVVQNNNKAFSLFKKAAGLDDMDGIIGLGLCYENGVGTKTLYKEAEKQYEIAHDRGNVEGTYYLGRLHINGMGSKPKPYSMGRILIEQAAKAGYVEAQYTLGTIYKNGMPGVPVDDYQAKYWFNIAAEHGHDGAKQELQSTRSVQNKASSKINSLTAIHQREKQVG